MADDGLSLTTIGKSGIAAGCLTLEAFCAASPEARYPKAALALFQSERVGSRNALSIYDEVSFGVLELVCGRGAPRERDRAGFLIRKDSFLVVIICDSKGRIAKAYENALEYARGADRVSLEHLVYVFLSHAALDYALLDELELALDRLDERSMGGHTRDFNAELSRIRHELLALHTHFEHLVSLGQTLMSNDNGVLGDDSLRFIRLFTDRTMRISDNITVLRESAEQLRETHQAQLDLEMNRIMKVFTVVTTIFLPLTLVTSWYGMNFQHMPELSWPYGYPLVSALSVLVVIACLILFRKKKLL